MNTNQLQLFDLVLSIVSILIVAVGWHVTAKTNKELAKKQAELEKEFKTKYSWRLNYIDRLVEWIDELEGLYSNLWQEISEYNSTLNYYKLEINKPNIDTKRIYEARKKLTFSIINKLPYWQSIAATFGGERLEVSINYYARCLLEITAIEEKELPINPNGEVMIAKNLVIKLIENRRKLFEEVKNIA